MKFTKKWFPIFVFLTVYLFTNFIGLMLLLFGPESYWKLSYAFTGMTLPDVYVDDLSRILVLAIGCPIVIVVGYHLGFGRSKGVVRQTNILPDIGKGILPILADIAFWIMSLMTVYRLLSLVGINGLENWIYYDRFIDARKLIIQNLPGTYFYIIYTTIPLCLTVSVIADIRGRRWVYMAVKMAVLILINLYIFQKRPLCNAFLMILFSIFVYFFIGDNARKQLSRRIVPIVAAVLALLYIIYAVGIQVTSIGEMSAIPLSATEQVNLEELQDSEKNDTTTNTGTASTETKVLYRRFQLEAETLSVSRFTYVNAMAFVGLLNRTAYFSIAYPIVFPEYLNYYPLDLGIGNMPNDSQVVYAMLNPQNPTGSGSAPFFTVLYSQGGLLPAIIGSLIVGICFALVWKRILYMPRPGIATAALGSMELLFAVLMAMASGRDSLLVSYGMLWPVFWLLAVYGVCWILFHRRREKGAQQRVCMLVTSGVINDSRVLREATICAESGFDTLLLGRCVPELGEKDEHWPFACRLIAIPRAADAGIFGKIIERIRIGLAFTAGAVKFKPDLIHCNDFDTLPFGFLASRICDSALIYDSHELWSENNLAGQSPVGKRLVKLLEGFFAKRCEGVISVSHSAGNWLRETYDLKKLVVVTNCPATGTVEKQDKNPGFELLCHGLFAEDRGYEELIACASMIESHGIQVRLRGYGPKTEHYKELAAQTGQKNIVFSEKVPSNQVCSAASASHVGIALTRPISKSYELTVSNKLFEYLAAGLPVILSDVPEHRLLNEEYQFGIILPEMTAQCLAEAAIRLKEDQDFYKRLAFNATMASRELRFEKEGEKLISLYRDALHETSVEERQYETNFA